LSKEVQSEVAWMYETKHNDKIQGIIEFVVWSDVFICPFCKNEYTLYDVAVDDDSGSVNIEYKCYHCGSNINKEKSSRAVIRKFDQAIKQEISVTKQLPVLINYKVGNKRYEKKPDGLDDDILNKIDVIEIPYWYPTDRMPVGDESRRNDKIGITHIHHFFTKRSLYVLSCIRQKLLEYRLPLFILSILLTNCSNMRRYGKRTGNVSGTLYIPSLIKELNVLEYLERKLYGPKGIINPLTKTQIICRNKEALISTQSLTNLGNIPDSTFDYIFTDPPFGENLMYSELNFITEAWLKVFTNNGQEAIINKSQAKDIDSYAKLMLDCFKECFRVLKPNRWITIEFHNSKAEIWKTIQEAIVKAGFIIGQVAVLDKKQGSFKQVTAPGTVKNDLVINAYKPSKKFAETFLNKAGLNMEQDFMDMHLDKMPIEPNVERTQQMLYSKLLAQYIQNGFEVRMDAMEFYSMLGTYFVERDGYWFKQEQIPEYEKRLKLAKNIGKADLNQLLLFVSDEKSTIIWLSQFLREPRTYSEIYTEWTQKWNERQDKMPELRDILEENFVTESGKWRLPSIGEKKEKEELRERRLAREFQDILEEAQSEKKVSSVRKEALLHGLMKLYNERNVNIINLLGKRLDKRIIESDDDIYAIIDWASSKGD